MTDEERNRYPAPEWLNDPDQMMALAEQLLDTGSLTQRGWQSFDQVILLVNTETGEVFRRSPTRLKPGEIIAIKHSGSRHGTWFAPAVTSARVIRQVSVNRVLLALKTTTNGGWTLFPKGLWYEIHAD